MSVRPETASTHGRLGSGGGADSLPKNRRQTGNSPRLSKAHRSRWGDVLSESTPCPPRGADSRWRRRDSRELFSPWKTKAPGEGLKSDRPLSWSIGFVGKPLCARKLEFLRLGVLYASRARSPVRTKGGRFRIHSRTLIGCRRRPLHHRSHVVRATCTSCWGMTRGSNFLWCCRLTSVYLSTTA